MKDHARAGEPELSSPRFRWALAAILVGGGLLRLGYLLAQPAHDPWFDWPAFDGAYYLKWARAWAGEGTGPEGAFYLAPLYPWLLSWWLRAAGENLGLLYLLQHGLGLATAGLIAVAGRLRLGAGAALAAAALYLLYAPLLFFASCPLGETLALFLLFAALAASWRAGGASGLAAGFLAGLAALARPNLLLVTLFWAAGEAAGHNRRRALLLLGGTVLALLPVALHNLGASGHLVPVSSNGGLTLYHGNGPGARGVYTSARGFTGALSSQRAEATALAEARSGRELDPVEADRWWGGQALRARLESPAATAALLGRRLLLTLDSHEYALDYAPELDANPWRPVLRLGERIRLRLVPLGLLLGLALAAAILRGFRHSGGWTAWTALAACALAPLLFYVSSRYRLPMAAMLVIPAGAGLMALLRPEPGLDRRRRLIGIGAAAVLCLASLLMPFGELKRSMTGQTLAGRAVAHHRAGELARALGDARRALALAPRSAIVQFNAGVVAEAAGEIADAEASYRRAFAIRPDLDRAAGNLAALLVRQGRVGEAIGLLRRALYERPSSEQCWNNLIAALLGAGRVDEARAATEESTRRGVALPPPLLEMLRLAGVEEAPRPAEPQGEDR